MHFPFHHSSPVFASQTGRGPRGLFLLLVGHLVPSLGPADAPRAFSNRDNAPHGVSSRGGFGVFASFIRGLAPCRRPVVESRPRSNATDKATHGLPPLTTGFPAQTTSECATGIRT